MAREISSVCDSLVVALEEKKQSNALLETQCACPLKQLVTKVKIKKGIRALNPRTWFGATKSLNQQ